MVFNESALKYAYLYYVEEHYIQIQQLTTSTEKLGAEINLSGEPAI